MASVIRMPQKGLSEESAILTRWYVKEGAPVKQGANLFSIETGKAVFDIECEEDGVLLKTFAEEGDEVLVNAPVCAIGQPGETCHVEDAPAEAAEPAPAQEQPAEAAAPAAAPVSTPATEDGSLRISPRARRTAVEKGIDYRFAKGTGPHGRIIERDIMAMVKDGPFITDAARALSTGTETGTGLAGAITVEDVRSAAQAAAPAAAPITFREEPEFEIVPNSNIRKIIAKNMHNSLSTMAQLTHTASADTTDIRAFRALAKEKGESVALGRITVNDIVMYAVVQALKEHPVFNAHYSDTEMKLFKTVNLGMAVDTPRGLMVPTIRHAERMSLDELSRTAKELAAACINNTVSPDQLKDATFTVSNLGMYGTASFTPIINPPQTGILGVCNEEYKVRMTENGPAFYPALNLSLTYDHRAVDGAPAARFLQTIVRNLEAFTLLLAK